MKITKGFLVYLSACLTAIFLCVASLTHAEAVPVLSIDKELDAGKDDVTADKAAKAKIQKAYGKLPLYFIRNDGQVDRKVKYYEKGKGHATFFTKEGVYLLLTRGRKTEHPEKLCNGAGRLPSKQPAGKQNAVASFSSANPPEYGGDPFSSANPPECGPRREHRQTINQGGNPKAQPVIASDQRERGNLKSEITRNSKPATHNSELIKLIPIGANKDPEIIAEGLQQGKVNYFTGNNPEKWRTNISTYRAVVYKEIYPGIDMKFYGSNRELEYDIIISPGADPSTLRLAYEGIESLRVTEEGELEIGLKACPEQSRGNCRILQKKPYIYQVIDGEKVEVEGKFVIRDRESSLLEDSKNTATDNGHGQRSYGFELASYDKDHPLIIDPALVYSTYLGGGSDDFGSSIAVDGSGNVYLTGSINSIDFPTRNPLQPNNAGGYDVFVTKINPAGDALVYSTYLGGGNYDRSYGIAVDSSGNAYLIGWTGSSNFPTQNPFQPNNAGFDDAFVTKINPTGDALVYSTYLGGSGYDEGSGIAVDISENAYLTGETSSIDFPTQNPFQPNNAGSDDVFVTKINPTGDALVYSTYLGGSGSDYGNGIAVDSSGNVYLTGDTWSIDFPTQNPLQPNYGGWLDVFVTKINPTGDALVYSTYLGGSDLDGGSSIAVDSSGNAYLTGSTYSTDFPTQNPLQPNKAGGYDAFVTKIGIDDPVPDIKANNSDGPVDIISGDLLTVTIELNSGNYAGQNADWYVYAATPLGSYYYDSSNWVPGSGITYSGPLSDLTTYEVLNSAYLPTLPVGAYTFCFDIDIGQIYSDCVVVNINPPPLTIAITSPADGTIFNTSPITVSGDVTNNAQVTVNGIQASVVSDTFTASIPLSEGPNTITAAAADQYSQTASDSITVTLITKGSINRDSNRCLNSPSTALCNGNSYRFPKHTTGRLYRY